MTEDQIKKLAEYVVFLRNRMDVYQQEHNPDIADIYWAKIEAVREVSIIFNCREEVFKMADELEGRK